MLRDATTKQPISQLATDQAGHIISKGGIWDYGTWPQNRYLNNTVTLAASASGTTVYELVDTTSYNGFIFEVVAIGGTATPTIKLSISLDGTNYAATLPQLINLVDGTAIAGATGVTAIGLYALSMPAAAKTKYKGIKLVQTGGAADQTCTVRYAHVWA